jgi:hypothetical protein
MEPHREERQEAPEPGAERKPRRFRIVRLEERIAPKRGGTGTNNGCNNATNVTICQCYTWVCGTCGPLSASCWAR